MYIGFAIHYLYNDQHEIINNINALCEDFNDKKISKSVFGNGYSENMAKIKEFVSETSLLEKYNGAYDVFNEKGSVDSVLSLTSELVRTRDSSFYPPERVSETIKVIREAGGKGIVVFAGGTIDQYSQWEIFEEAFSKNAKRPYPDGLQRSVSSVGLKTHQKEINRLITRIRKLTSLSYTYGTIALILFLFLLVILLRKMKKQ